MHTRQRSTWRQVFGRRRCACGLPWPCLGAWLDERREGEEGRLQTNVSAAVLSVSNWAGPTMPIFQTARAGALTLAQELRSRRGSSC